MEIADKKQVEEDAKAKLNSARSSNGGGVMLPTAKLASSMPGASKLIVGNGTGLLRKPTTTTSSSSLLLKKPISSTSKLRVSKLGVNLSSKNGDEDDQFEDIEETQRKVVEAEERAKQIAQDEELAKKLQQESS